MATTCNKLVIHLKDIRHFFSVRSFTPLFNIAFFVWFSSYIILVELFFFALLVYLHIRYFVSYLDEEKKKLLLKGFIIVVQVEKCLNI